MRRYRVIIYVEWSLNVDKVLKFIQKLPITTADDQKRFVYSWGLTIYYPEASMSMVAVVALSASMVAGILNMDCFYNLR